MGLSKKRILVTGATGFVGANLIRSLIQSRCEIGIFSRTTSDFWRIQDIKKKLKNFSLDLREDDKVKKALKDFKPHIIFHLGCFGGYTHQRDADKMVSTNITGSFNLIKSVNPLSLELFVNVGSSSEYGPKKNPMHEDDRLAPVSVYGASKAASSLIANAFSSTFNIPIVNVRLFSPFGYFEDAHRFIPSFIISALRRRAIKLTPGRQRRDFLFISEVINAFLKIIDYRQDVIGQTINIASGKDYSLRQVARIILRELGNPIKPGWGVLAYRENEQFCWRADIRKARALLGWQPEVSLNDGLGKTVEWFRQNLGRFKHYE
ncbi:MAG: NAD-dependent epimerase/dehydratase family protein [Candidatus Omnitrophica bacterium]|nr:NAD-dependent epimerase/dehydratase family protein [Candidatus Omnitrophota bacterium]